MKKKKSGFRNRGFTLIELIIVVVIISIAAIIAVPMFSSAAGTQVLAAADMIAADLEYAKTMAISRQKTYTVIFDEAAESYSITDESGVISHPVKIGFPYVVNFKADSRIDRVNIVDADFALSEQVSFDYLGSPERGGTVKLAGGGTTMIITVEPVTGYISISQ